MPERKQLLLASTDRSLPKKFEGKIEPNFYCRAWNEKRQKYCRATAGRGTSHSGRGRCKVHGGLQPDGDERVTTGTRSRVLSGTLGQLIEQERNRPDPLNLEGELATLRALVADLRARKPEEIDHASEITLAESIGRMVERIERIRSTNAISWPELNRITAQLWLAVDVHVKDEATKDAIRADWGRIQF